LVIEQFSGTIPTTIDGPAVASSLIVLFLLLALSFNRIFGLERLVGCAAGGAFHILSARSCLLLLLLLLLSSSLVPMPPRRMSCRQWLRQLAEQRDKERRSESQAARQALERQFGGDDGGEGGKDDSA
jgi:hypothetical protein